MKHRTTPICPPPAHKAHQGEGLAARAQVVGSGEGAPCYSLDALITLGAIRIWKATAIAYGENHRKTLRALNEARREAGNIIGKGLQ